MTLRHFTATLFKHVLPIGVCATVLGIFNVNQALAEERDTTPVMKLGSVRWHLKKQGVFELSADKSRLVIGDKLDSTISVVDVETGQVVRTLEQQFHKGAAQTGKFTNLIIDEHGQHIAINSYQSEVDSAGWVIVRVEDGKVVTERLEQFAIKALSISRDRIVVSDANPRIAPQLTIRRLSDNSVIKSLGIWGWSEYEEATGRLFVVADRVIRAFDIASGEEIGRWGVDKADAISKDPRSDWIYASTIIGSGNSQDANLVECVNIATRKRIVFEPDAFAGDCASCLGISVVHVWSSSAESSYLNGELLPGQRNPMWRVDAADSSVKLWLNPRFTFNGRPVPHVATYLDEHKYYIHMISGSLDSGGIWCHEIVPNTTSVISSPSDSDKVVKFVNDELVISQMGEAVSSVSVVVSSIDGKRMLQRDFDADAIYPIRIRLDNYASGTYICTISGHTSVASHLFTIVR